MNQAHRTKFLVELIKPSHYDDDGYLIQWWRGFVPSSSLSNLYGLALDAQSRRILGDGVDLDIEAHDETNAKVPVGGIVRRFKRNANRGIVLLVGVQTNQFARAVDIARELRACVEEQSQGRRVCRRARAGQGQAAADAALASGHPGPPLRSAPCQMRRAGRRDGRQSNKEMRVGRINQWLGRYPHPIARRPI